MGEGTLDIEPLRGAVRALGGAIDVYNRNLPDADSVLRDTLRSGVIKNFEVAYELCWKYMKKWLEMNIGPDVVTGVHRREFYRIARENGLIPDVKAWWKFHESRNETVHVYDLEVAVDIFEVSQVFLPAAQQFIVDLEGMI